MKRVILVLCFTAVILSAQVKKENYVVCALQKGSITEGHFIVKDKYLVKINGGELWKEIVVAADDSINNYQNYKIYFISAKSIATHALSFIKKGNNLYTAVEETHTTDGDKISKLCVILDAEKKLIKYRWDNKDNYEVPKIVKEYPLKKGKLFPKISVKTEKGIWNSDSKNKIIVINWWSTGCAPCRDEMPGLNKLVEKYKGKDVEFLSIVNDKVNLAGFLKNNRFDYLQGYGNKKIVKMFGEGFPRNIIIDKNGIILHNQTGASPETWEELDKIIQSNL
jgi:thiol-disulfide isomerase/thioredoxin